MGLGVNSLKQHKKNIFIGQAYLKWQSKYILNSKVSISPQAHTKK